MALLAMAIIARCAAGMQRQLQLLEVSCSERGLTVNLANTRAMLMAGAVSPADALQHVARARLTYAGGILKGSVQFKYLGVVFHCTVPLGEYAAATCSRAPARLWPTLLRPPLRAAALTLAWRQPACSSPCTHSSSTPPSPTAQLSGPPARGWRLRGGDCAARAACQQGRCNITALYGGS